MSDKVVLVDRRDPRRARSSDDAMLIGSLPFLLGLLAGSRTFTPLAAVSWAAGTGRLSLRNVPILGTPGATAALTLLAAGELMGDKLPGLGRRTSPTQFAARLASGAACGAAFGVSGRARFGLLAGLVGAALGTVVSAAARSSLAKRLGADLPAALVEDAVTLASAAVLLRSATHR